jgi:hypothetical protein
MCQLFSALAVWSMICLQKPTGVILFARADEVTAEYIEKYKPICYNTLTCEAFYSDLNI